MFSKQINRIRLRGIHLIHGHSPSATGIVEGVALGRWFANHRRGSLRRNITASILCLTLSAQTPLFSQGSLAEKSPFLPPGYGKEEPKPQKPVVQPQGPISREIEFRGIVEIEGAYQFSIFNKKEQKSYWLKENEREDGISVNSFDQDGSTIVVMMNGRSERLDLMTATEKPLPVAKAKRGGTNKRRPPGLPPQARNKNSDSDQKRRRVPRRRVILPKKN